MNEKGRGAADTLAIIGGLSAFVGMGVLAAAVGMTWKPENTSSLITAGAAVCGGGLAIFAAVFGVFMGMGVYRRMQRADGDQAHELRTLPAARSWQEPRAPMLANPDKAGTWAGGGPQVYDLWQDDGTVRVYREIDYGGMGEP
ncbi:MAG: hypothetical protein J5I90_06400 [Caldilineales bacterium]|nr:hypothetical protein [Caldilineales bacterium]